MPENEAIERLKCMRLFMEIEDKRNESKFLEDDYVANKMAIEALKKQKPNKIWGNEHNPIVTGDTVRGLCPICYTEFICITPRYYKGNGFGYCRQCGQKLDWDD